MTRKNFGAKPFCYPQPVFIIGTYNKEGQPNAMNAAWGGISNHNEVSLCISAGHLSTKNIMETHEFTLSMATADQMIACDFVGIASGNDDNSKIEKTQWHSAKAEFVNAPIFEELPLTMECRMKSYDASCGRLIAEIINVSADERVLNENGNVDPAKLQPICFDPFNNAYNVLGIKIGNAFKDGSSLK